MNKFHLVLMDETGSEFGASVRATNRKEAWEIGAEEFPECRIVRVRTDEEQAKVQARAAFGW